MTRVMDVKKMRHGRWSLSEFLNLVEVRSQAWCSVNLGQSSGFRIPHNDVILLYVVLEGAAQIVGATPEPLDLHTGDTVLILSGQPHALRSEQGGDPDVLDFLHNGVSLDMPPNITLGHRPTAARLLCGRLEVRWPGDQNLPSMPPILTLKAGDSVINVEELELATRQSGGSAIPTCAARLLFTVAFRAHPQAELIFRSSTLHDRIARARQLIQTHPFIDWSVGLLARKVGLGRSSFAAEFAAEVGRTPIHFVADERMKLAANLLKTSDLKIAEISKRTGYRSEAAFSRRFTAYFGMSPGKMRKTWRWSQRQPAASAASPTLQ